MANNCFYDMRIQGDDAAIGEFIDMMRDGKLGRVLSVEADSVSDHEAIVSGDCAWSLNSALRLDGKNWLGEPEESAFLNEMRRLGLSAEAYSEEPGNGFAEHIVFDKGGVAINEETDLFTYPADELTAEEIEDIAEEHKVTVDAVVASIVDEDVRIGGYDQCFDGKPAKAAVSAVLRERFLSYIENEIQESETGMFFVEDDAWLQDDGFSPAEVRAMADELAADERTELVMEVGEDPFITFYPDFKKYLQAERETLLGVSVSHGNLMNDRSIADCGRRTIDSMIHAAEAKGIESAFDAALGTGAVFAARISDMGTEASARYGLLSNAGDMRLSGFLEQGADCASGVDTLLLTTDQGKAMSVVEECHGAEKVVEVEFRQLKPFEAYKMSQLLQNGGLDAAELDSLAAKTFMGMGGLQTCTDLAEQMDWECSSERAKLAEALWKGDPERGIESLAELDFDDENRIAREWMGYAAGTPIAQVWKDFDKCFGKDGVSVNELSGFCDRRIEAENPGHALSESEFDKLFGSLARNGTLAEEHDSDVNRDADRKGVPGSGDDR